jgi:hypothetical protein
LGVEINWQADAARHRTTRDATPAARKKPALAHALFDELRAITIIEMTRRMAANPGPRKVSAPITVPRTAPIRKLEREVAVAGRVGFTMVVISLSS